MRQDTSANRFTSHYDPGQDTPPDRSASEKIPSSLLLKDDLIYVGAGEIIPVDGEIIQGIASVNESAITGESAPVIREAGGDRSAVTGGTTVLSDWLVIRVTANPGEGFLDKMIPAHRRGEAAEDSQRDRAEYSSYQPHRHLHHCLQHPLCLLLV